MKANRGRPLDVGMMRESFDKIKEGAKKLADRDGSDDGGEAEEYAGEAPDEPLTPILAKQLLINIRDRDVVWYDLNDSNLDWLLDVGSLISLDNLDSVMEEGQEASFTAILLKGTLDIIFGLNASAKVDTPGAMIGQAGYFVGGKRNANVFAHGRVWLLLLPYDTIRSMERDESNVKMHGKMLTFLAMSSVRTLNAIVASQNDQIAEFTGGKNKNVASLHREKLLEKAHMAKINKEQRIQERLKDKESVLKREINKQKLAFKRLENNQAKFEEQALVMKQKAINKELAQKMEITSLKQRLKNTEHQLGFEVSNREDLELIVLGLKAEAVQRGFEGEMDRDVTERLQLWEAQQQTQIQREIEREEEVRGEMEKEAEEARKAEEGMQRTGEYNDLFLDSTKSGDGNARKSAYGESNSRKLMKGVGARMSSSAARRASAPVNSLEAYSMVKTGDQDLYRDSTRLWRDKFKTKISLLKNKMETNEAEAEAKAQTDAAQIKALQKSVADSQALISSLSVAKFNLESDVATLSARLDFLSKQHEEDYTNSTGANAALVKELAEVRRLRVTEQLELKHIKEKIAKHKLYAESQKAQREELEGQIEEREQDYKKKMDRITTYENEVRMMKAQLLQTQKTLEKEMSEQESLHLKAATLKQDIKSLREEKITMNVVKMMTLGRVKENRTVANQYRFLHLATLIQFWVQGSRRRKALSDLLKHTKDILENVEATRDGDKFRENLASQISSTTITKETRRQRRLRNRTMTAEETITQLEATMTLLGEVIPTLCKELRSARVTRDGLFEKNMHLRAALNNNSTKAQGEFESSDPLPSVRKSLLSSSLQNPDSGNYVSHDKTNFSSTYQMRLPDRLDVGTKLLPINATSPNSQTDRPPPTTPPSSSRSFRFNTLRPNTNTATSSGGDQPFLYFPIAPTAPRQGTSPRNRMSLSPRAFTLKESNDTNPKWKNPSSSGFQSPRDDFKVNASGNHSGVRQGTSPNGDSERRSFAAPLQQQEKFVSGFFSPQLFRTPASSDTR